MTANDNPKALEFDDDDAAAGWGWPGALRCPGCGCDNLHHDEVEVRERNREDEPGTLTTVVASHHFARPPTKPFRIDLQRPLGPETQITPCDKGFAGRRNDVRIKFWCERCECRPTLLLVQHKGTTFLYWDQP